MEFKLKPKVEAITVCGVDGSMNLKSIWKLPQFPITEAFGAYDENYPNIDQELMLCMSCGHLQLKNQVDPNFLYNVDNYAFRTQNNNKILKEFEFIHEFITELQSIPGQIRAVEIGASNLALAQFLMQKNKFSSYTVCDPLFAAQETTEEEGINVIGKLIENAGDDLKHLDINFVIGRHVLEHVLNPLELLRNILKHVKPGTIFVFEVPSLELLRKGLRFDAVFHQHCQYFDESSIKILLKELDCNLISMTFNNKGSNGGSILFAFATQTLPSQFFPITSPQISAEKKYSDLIIEIEVFRNAMKVYGQIIKNLPFRKIGYGAAHMLATLNFHTDGAVEALEFIIDDDHSKSGMSYKNVKVSILHPREILINEDVMIVPTSFENQSSIVRKILESYPNKVISFPIF
jgi:SAM-dependent methyltransferase